MHTGHDKESSEGIVALIKETADGFGQLIADHIKLARLELVVDLKTQGRRVAAMALIIPLIFLGYGLICVALSLVLSRSMGLPAALFLVGGVHVAAGAIGVAIAVAKLKRANIMQESASEVSRSITTLSGPEWNGASRTSNLDGAGGASRRE
jgi:uncharacterized membrane protein